MEVIRTSPADRFLVQRYRGGGFTVSGVRHSGSILILPKEVKPWPVADIAAMDAAWLVPLLAGAGVNLCLVGCGPRTARLPATLKQAFKDAAIGIDVMETGAASRTYNMLVGEGRAVAAALIPLP